MVEVKFKVIEPRAKEVVPAKPKFKEVKVEESAKKQDTGNLVKNLELEERTKTSDAPASSWTSSATVSAPVLAQTPREIPRVPQNAQPERTPGTREFSAYETMRREDAARPYNPAEHSPTLAPILPARTIQQSGDSLLANPDRVHSADQEREYIRSTKLEDTRPKRKMPWE